MRTILLSALLCGGCFDYEHLSNGFADGATVDAAEGADGGTLPDEGTAPDGSSSDDMAHTPVQVNLSGAFNVAGVYVDTSTFAANGGIDGSGNAASATALAAAGTWMGTPITGPANTADTVQTTGQALVLPSGMFSSLTMLAVSVNGAPLASFSVTYTDASKTIFTQGISDFLAPQAFAGEVSAVVMPYFLRYNGTKDNRVFHIYGYSFALDASKTVASIALPNSPNVRLFAMSLQP